jgi:hypothetical protein
MQKMVCTVDFMDKFAGHLFEQVNDHGEPRFTVGTAKQIISGAKAVLERTFGDDCWLRNDPTGVRKNVDWYEGIRHELGKRFIIRCFQLGETLFPVVCKCIYKAYAWIR